MSENIINYISGLCTIEALETLHDTKLVPDAGIIDASVEDGSVSLIRFNDVDVWKVTIEYRFPPNSAGLGDFVAAFNSFFDDYRDALWEWTSVPESGDYDYELSFTEQPKFWTEDESGYWRCRIEAIGKRL